jgi:hypothetical protein
VDRKHFQLLGATCLHIASKCEDVSYIGVDDLVVCADRVFVSAEVLALEEKVLNVLDFRLAVPTAVDFVNAFVARLQLDDESESVLQGKHSVAGAVVGKDGSRESLGERQAITPLAIALSRYLTELSLQGHAFIARLPSEVAAAAVVLALYYVGQKLVPKHFFLVTGYTFKDLKWAVTKLRESHLEAPLTSSLTVIRRRYQRDVNLFAAGVRAKPSLAGIDWDTQPF